jgi:hypothetical protein
MQLTTCGWLESYYPPNRVMYMIDLVHAYVTREFLPPSRALYQVNGHGPLIEAYRKPWSFSLCNHTFLVPWPIGIK